MRVRSPRVSKGWLALVSLDMSSFLDTLKDRIVVFDGAMGTNLHAQDLSVDDYGGPQFEGCPEHLLISKPVAVEKVHAGFLEVGCDVV